MATQAQVNKWLLSLPQDERQNVAQSSAMGRVHTELVTGSKTVAKATLPKGQKVTHSTK